MSKEEWNWMRNILRRARTRDISPNALPACV